MFLGLDLTLADAQTGGAAALFAAAGFRANLITSLILSKGSGSPTFTRADASPCASVTDQDGILRTALSGEARFSGARRVQNLLTYSQDFTNSVWNKSNATITAAATTAPDGTTTGQKIAEDNTNNLHVAYYTVAPPAGTYTFSIYAKAAERNYLFIWNGTNGGFFNLTTGAFSASGAAPVSSSATNLGNGWWRCQATYASAPSRFEFGTSADGSSFSYLGTTGYGIYAWGAQLENVTGQSNQAAGDYVSTNVLAAPYHGAGVDGVQYFPSFYGQNLLTYSQDFTNAAWIKSNLTVTPNATTDPFGGNNGTLVNVPGAGFCYLQHSFTALPANTYIYSVWLKGLVGGEKVRWPDIGGVTTTTTLTTSWVRYSFIYTGTPSTILIESGGYSGVYLPFYIYGVQIEPAAVGQTAPTDYLPTTSTALSATTPTTLSDATLLGYLAEGSATNICLQSNAFTTTWTSTSALGTLTQNAVGPDGATSAWTMTDNSGIAAGEIHQAITLTAAQYTYSVFVKKTSGATTYPVLFMVTGTNTSVVTIDTNNGIATPWTAYTGNTIITTTTTCQNYNANYWRVTATMTGTSAVYTFYIDPAATANATQSTGQIDVTQQGTNVFYGAQVELGSFATSYIPTTTTNVTRAADKLTYATAGNLVGTVGSAYSLVTALGSQGGNQGILDADSAGNRGLFDTNSALKLFSYDGTNSPTSAAAMVVGTKAKTGMSYSGSVLNVCLNGTNLAGTFDGDFNVGTNLGIMSQSQFNPGQVGNIRDVYIWQTALTAAQLQLVTAP